MELSNIISQLNWRAAIKAFDINKKVSDSDFDQLVEVARLTASSYGLQPWKFVVVKNPEVRAQLQAASYGQSQVTQASHFVVLCSKLAATEADADHYLEVMAKTRGIEVEALAEFRKSLVGLISNKNEAELKAWSAKQVYIVLGNLLTACAVAGIDTCPMEGFDSNKYNEILELDELGFTATVACAIGYRDASDESGERKKVRYEKSEVVIEI